MSSSQIRKTLRNFQQQVGGELQELQTKWKKCDEFWKGDTKERFTKEFEETTSATQSALEAGEDAQKWLEKFLEIVK
jgi:uncharacterized protein YukE